MPRRSQNDLSTWATNSAASRGVDPMDAANAVLARCLASPALVQEQRTRAFAPLRPSARDDADGLEMGPREVTLLCPLSKAKISVPVRGPDCRHTECYELTAFAEAVIKQNRQSRDPSMLCPVTSCRKKVYLSGVVIDYWLQSVLRRPDMGAATKFTMHPDGRVVPTSARDDRDDIVIPATQLSQSPRSPIRVKPEPDYDPAPRAGHAVLFSDEPSPQRGPVQEPSSAPGLPPLPPLPQAPPPEAQVCAPPLPLHNPFSFAAPQPAPVPAAPVIPAFQPTDPMLGHPVAPASASAPLQSSVPPQQAHHPHQEQLTVPDPAVGCPTSAHLGQPFVPPPAVQYNDGSNSNSVPPVAAASLLPGVPAPPPPPMAMPETLPPMPSLDVPPFTAPEPVAVPQPPGGRSFKGHVRVSTVTRFGQTPPAPAAALNAPAVPGIPVTSSPPGMQMSLPTPHHADSPNSQLMTQGVVERWDHGAVHPAVIGRARCPSCMSWLDDEPYNPHTVEAQLVVTSDVLVCCGESKHRGQWPHYMEYTGVHIGINTDPVVTVVVSVSEGAVPYVLPYLLTAGFMWSSLLTFISVDPIARDELLFVDALCRAALEGPIGQRIRFGGIPPRFRPRRT